MLIPVKHPQSGKILFKWDPEKKIIEIVQRKGKTLIYLNKDGTYIVRTDTKATA